MAREDGNCEVWVGVEGLEDGRTEVPAGLGREWVSEGGLLCFALLSFGLERGIGMARIAALDSRQ